MSAKQLWSSCKRNSFLTLKQLLVTATRSGYHTPTVNYNQNSGGNLITLFGHRYTLYLGQSLELVHGEVGEEDDHVLLHPHYQPRVPLVPPANHTYVVALG